MGKKLKIEIGHKFEMLTVVRELSITERKIFTKNSKRKSNVYYECKCDCGNITILPASRILKPRSKSCGCIKDKTSPDSAFKHLIYQYNYSANRKGISFDLKEEEFKLLTSSNCYYCGIPPNKIVDQKLKYQTPYHYNGVDRIDSDVGYNLDNCRPCCEQCNRMKLDWTEKEFLQKIKEIHNYLKLR